MNRAHEKEDRRSIKSSRNEFHRSTATQHPQATTTVHNYTASLPPPHSSNMSAIGMVTLEQATWAWIMAGPAKHRLPIGKRFVKAFMAGLFLSMGGMLVDVLTADPWFTTNAPGLLKIIQGVCFPVGLVMIVLLQMDLVTGQTAIMLMATIKRKVPLWAWIADWALVFVGNLAGALCYTGIVYGANTYSPAMATGAAGVSVSKSGPTTNFGQVLVRGESISPMLF